MKRFILSASPAKAAAAAHLRYVDAGSKGIRREKRKDAFVYINETTERLVRDAATLARIRSLAIPPAWTNVWICAQPSGHIQALGRDAKGRKQYRYHAHWRQTRDQTKFGRMIAFAQALPHIRKRVALDLGQQGLPRERVLATLVALLATTGIRVGGDEYARQNKHYGLTTLMNRHVTVKGEKLRFRFVGKSGKTHEVGVRNARVAGVIRRCLEIPGQRLFQYIDEQGDAHTVHSEDVNEYLHELAGEEFTAKDFRTWVGTVTAAANLFGCDCPQTQKAKREKILEAIDGAALRLGNTRSICRASYIHPAILTAFEEGRMGKAVPLKTTGRRGLDPIERATLQLLRLAARAGSGKRAKTSAIVLASAARLSGR
ncbi:MAG: DNA topoisomerase IB [Deltaproteobacteria bacterium]|nr:DNA topoisomerase IB [Deltaproteobacteria bacterium]